mmetsp:Transcript_2025/g.3679  ORF Transcript_2025/g.3679 Transcript_2025/m.3679 type:complete len:170 (-) Transcript_2025:2270-2779(-)
MPNLVPPLTDLTEEDHMSPELRAQFRALQQLSMHRKNKSPSSDPNNVKNHDLAVLEHLTSHSGDTDDETLSYQMDSRPLSLDSSHHHHFMSEDPAILQLALLTAITAQNEINSLVNGIRELETFMQPSCCPDLSLFNSQQQGHVHDSSCVTSVTTGNGDCEKKVPFVNE